MTNHSKLNQYIVNDPVMPKLEKHMRKVKEQYYNRDKSFSYKACFYAGIGMAMCLIYLILTA